MVSVGGFGGGAAARRSRDVPAADAGQGGQRVVAGLAVDDEPVGRLERLDRGAGDGAEVAVGRVRRAGAGGRRPAAHASRTAGLSRRTRRRSRPSATSMCAGRPGRPPAARGRAGTTSPPAACRGRTSHPPALRAGAAAGSHRARSCSSAGSCGGSSGPRPAVGSQRPWRRRRTLSLPCPTPSRSSRAARRCGGSADGERDAARLTARAILRVLEQLGRAHVTYVAHAFLRRSMTPGPGRLRPVRDRSLGGS